jgi:two-component system, OmpR family, response regulator CpxR
VMAYMLDVNGYRVLSASSKREAVGLMCATHIDCVLTEWAVVGDSGEEVIQALKKIQNHVPMIIRGDLRVMSELAWAADRLLSKTECSTQQLLETVKVMAARKRGPRKGTKHSVASVVAPELAEVSA